MRQKLRSLLARLALAFVAVATATMIAILLRQFATPATSQIVLFLFLGIILACSWVGGYTSGIASVVFATLVGQMLSHRPPDPYRLALLLLLAGAVGWIASHRRRLEAELRSRVEHSTAELQSAVQRLEREIQERKAAEEEIRRLNLRLEARVDERTRQLEISNHELESFSYSVSHDLRAPLRSIDGFTRILLGVSGHKFDDEEKALFERVLNAANRMNGLIEDLLNLSRVTRTEIHAEPVDLSAIVTRVTAEMARQQPATRFLIQPGIQALCDPGLVEVVLRNLLENGCKFSSRIPEPCIEFGSTTLSGEPVLYIRDNGAGFDPAYESKLFTPFQRLHRQEEFPGTGIGLATVSRIIKRHGGWIKGESRLGQGATFYFTLRPSATGDRLLSPASPAQAGTVTRGLPS